jgi:hypothetical protein
MADKISSSEELNQQVEAVHSAIGHCLMRWAMVEAFMNVLFVKLVDGSPNVAAVVWDSVVSFEAKLKALTNVVYYVVQDEALREIWKKLGARLSEKHKKRNEIVHANVVNMDEKRVVLIPFWSPWSKGKTELQEKELLERADSFKELSEAVQWFNSFLMFLDVPGAKSQIPIPDLIHQFRQTIDQKRAEDGLHPLSWPW